MPSRLTELKELVINRVAFVPAGDNPKADVMIWKSHDENAPPKEGDLKTTKAKTVTPSRLRRLQEQHASLGDLLDELGGSEGGTVNDDTAKMKDDLPDDLPDEVTAYLKALEDERDEATKAAEETEERVTALEAAAKAKADDADERTPLEKALAKSDLDPDTRQALELAKAADERATAAEERIEKAEIEKATEVAKVTVAGWKNLAMSPDDFGPELAKLRKDSPETATAIEDVLKRVNAQMTEFGKTIGADGGEASDADEKLQGIADALAKADPKLSPEQAMAKAVRTTEGRELYKQHVDEIKEGVNG